MPIARHRAASPGRPADESMMRVVPALAGSALIRSQSAKPSMSGISESVSTSCEGGAAGVRACSMAASAARPVLTAVGAMPQWVSMSRMMRRLIE